MPVYRIKKDGPDEPICRAAMETLVAQAVKRLPIMRETWVQSLGWEDPLGGGNGNPH